MCSAGTPRHVQDDLSSFKLERITDILKVAKFRQLILLSVTRGYRVSIMCTCRYAT